MKIKIDARELLLSLRMVKTSIKKRSPIPVFGCVGLQAKDGFLTVRGPSISPYIERVCPCEVIESGAIIVSYKRLKRSVGALPEGLIAIEKLDDTAHIHSNFSSFHLSFLPISDWPEATIEEAVGEEITIDSADLLSMLNETSYAMSEDETRIRLTGLLMELKDGVFTVASADGPRMVFSRCNGFAKDVAVRKILRPKMVSALKRMLVYVGGDATLVFGDDTMSCAVDGVTIRGEYIPGEFPSQKPYELKEDDHTIRVRKDAFSRLIRGSRGVTSERWHSVTLEPRAGFLYVRSSTPGIGDYQGSIFAECSYSALTLKYNPKFLLDAVDRIEGDVIVLSYSDEKTRCVVCGEDERYLTAIMPIRQ